MGNTQSDAAWFDYPFTEDAVGVPFGGDTPRLFVSIDVGATHSAVAVALLQSNHAPVLFRIADWPANRKGDAIPSVIHYTASSISPVAVGAESPARSPNASKVYDVRYFKLRFLTQNSRKLLLDSLVPEEELEDLPPDVTLQQIYSDYLRYLLKYTQASLHLATGEDMWGLYGEAAEIILTHPNLCDDGHRQLLRKAAIDANLISQERAKNSLYFFEEAEACTRYFVAKYATRFSDLKEGARVMVCDAGGSTVDITTFEVKRTDKKRMRLNEVAASCTGAGGIHVDLAFRIYLAQKLRRFSREPTFRGRIAEATQDFEEQAKRVFRYPTDRGLVRFRTPLRDGSKELRLDSPTMNSFFQPTITKIIDEARAQAKSVDYIILTGGFGASPYLRREFDAFSSRKCEVVSPNDAQILKPVAVGALLLRVSEELKGRKKGIFRRWAGR